LKADDIQGTMTSLPIDESSYFIDAFFPDIGLLKKTIKSSSSEMAKHSTSLDTEVSQTQRPNNKKHTQ